MKHPYMLILIALIICIAPACASGIVVTGGNINISSTAASGWTQSYVYTSTDYERIAIMEWDIPLNSVTNFSLTYGNGQTVDGWIIYRPVDLLTSYSEVSIGGVTYADTFLDTHVAVGCMAQGVCLNAQIKFTSYAKNTSEDPVQTGFAIYAQGYGLYTSQLAFYPVDNVATNLISEVRFTSDKDVYLYIQNDITNSMAKYVSLTVGEAVSQQANDIFSVLLGYVSSFLSAIGAAFYWIKFFLVDNLVLVVILYIMGTLAAAVATEALKSHPNPLNIFTTFFKFQVEFIKGFLWLWGSLINMLTQLVQAILKWV
ncbi:MAG: hypothetical protein WC455_24720 [Dehalococcoidia bacterium]